MTNVCEHDIITRTRNRNCTTNFYHPVAICTRTIFGEMDEQSHLRNNVNNTVRLFSRNEKRIQEFSEIADRV